MLSKFTSKNEFWVCTYAGYVLKTTKPNNVMFTSAHFMVVVAYFHNHPSKISQTKFHSLTILNYMYAVQICLIKTQTDVINRVT